MSGRFVRTFSAALAGAAMAGCFALPVPVLQGDGARRETRSTVGETPPSELVSGVTTRRQVLLLLGEPDGRPTLDSRFIYQTVTKRAGVHWGLFIVTMANQTGFARLGDWHKSQRLIIDFNEHGIVTNVAVDSRNCSQDPEHIIGQPDCALSSTTLQ